MQGCPQDVKSQDRDVCVMSVMRRDVVSVLNVSVSRRSRDVFWNVSVSSRSRLGLEDITSGSRVSGFMTLGPVNIGAMHQAFGYIRKKLMDLKTNYATRKKQVVK